MRSIVCTLAFSLTAVAFVAAPAHAQGRNVPGTVHSDVSADLSDYKKEVRRLADDILGQWRDAWGNDDAGVMSTLYTPDAVLVPLSGETLHGRREIRTGLAALVGKAGPITITRLDFGTSGELAYDVEQFTYAIEENGHATKVHTGISVIVFKRHWDGHWEIQSQSLALLPDTQD